MENHKNCPMCKKELVSDASKLPACALCGMVIDSHNMLMAIQDGDELFFCLNGCYNKYNKINNLEEHN